MDNWHAEAVASRPGCASSSGPPASWTSFPTASPTPICTCFNYSQLRIVGESLARVLAGRDSRRRPVHQEPQLPNRAGRPRAARRTSSGADRHAHRKPPAGFVEPDGFRHARRAGSRAQFARCSMPRTIRFARRRLSARVRPFLLRRTKIAGGAKTCPTGSRKICSARSKASRRRSTAPN